MWASYPILIFVLFLFPLVIIFEEVFVALIMAVLGLADYPGAHSARVSHLRLSAG